MSWSMVIVCKSIAQENKGTKRHLYCTYVAVHACSYSQYYINVMKLATVNHTVAILLLLVLIHANALL